MDQIQASGSTCGKELIPLSLGDPTVYGNLSAPDALTEAVVKCVRAKRSNGYAHSAGVAPVREAVAKFMSTEEEQLTADDIVMASGGSGALELAISALVNEGDNILVPKPGFPLYRVIAESNGATVREYSLDPSQSWAIDIPSVEAQINENTKAILVNNPSNPCGALLTDDNLRELIAVAEKHRLPIVADEIYGRMTFTGHKFRPIASLSQNVPVIAMSGMAKMFLVPGWRVGWLCIHDRGGKLAELKQGIINLSQLILGANTIAQSALNDILTEENEKNGQGELEAFNQSYVSALEAAAKFSMRELSTAHGLKLIEPQGAMYMMVQLDPKMFVDIEDDQEFAQKLLKEEAVFVLPGSCFGAPNFFRIVFTAPEDILGDAYSRIVEFCGRHAK